MLRIVQNNVAAGAKNYYSTADYYTEGQELQGIWRGRGAALLGLEGPIEKADWDALCDNRNPNTGKSLTARQKSNRRVGYDFNFHVPKSISLLYGLTQDERLVDALRGAVGETMRDIEDEMQARVRKGGRDEDRTTGNMAWGEFVHTTARPVNGVPDPHLHVHAFVMNSTWDPEEKRWKAGQFANIKRDAPYFEALFHSRLARKMEEFGLPVERTRKGWELADVPRAALRKFSRRTAVIEKAAEARGITDATAKGELGARTRERKQKAMSFHRLQEEWRSRLSEDEQGALAAMSKRVGGPALPENAEAARDAVTFALDHCFERSAVLPQRKVLLEALRHGVGGASLERVVQELSSRRLLTAKSGGQRLVSTSDVLSEEKHMLAFAREGRGACAPLGSTPHVFRRDWLNKGQRAAIEHLLQSRDRVMLFRGRAGTGKTSTMQEAAEAIAAGGHQVFAFAPSADASRGVLRTEGFADADTVARLLLDPDLQERARGQVLWIDEASLLGSRTMAELFDLADRIDARLVLSGDRRQHGSVERGSALRLLEEEAGLVPAELREIQRQSGDYRRAVEALSEGRTERGLKELDRLGWVRELPDVDRDRVIAKDYAESLREGASTLVVSPTHREGERITAAIRAELQGEGWLGADSRLVPELDSLNLTEAERADRGSYVAGDVLVFHQNAKGYRRGERVVISDPATVPVDQAARFQVFRRATLAVAPGEVLRVTRNGTTLNGKHRLNNGSLVAVKTFDARGNLVLANGWTVARDYGHLAHGYVITSHASQGKTVDRVLIAQSSDSFPASSREQLYVSVSRGRKRATIYTDSRGALLDAVARSEDRMTATELVRLARVAEERDGARDTSSRSRAMVQAHQMESLDHDR